jgi:hypothetical protein
MSPTDSKFKSVFRVVSGNFLEMYDFMVYGYYASAIAKTYFPSGNEFASLMLALSVFGAGFLMRPIGAIVLGAYIDHHGRRKGLILTLAMMAAGTLPQKHGARKSLECVKPSFSRILTVKRFAPYALGQAPLPHVPARPHAYLPLWCFAG